MGTFGALMGSLIAGLAYTLSGRNYTVTFSLSAIPALGALLLVSSVSLCTLTVILEVKQPSISRIDFYAKSVWLIFSFCHTSFLLCS